MPDSTFEILEFRCKILPEWTECYIRCSPDSDGGVLVGGWYKKTISINKPALEFLQKALLSSSYLLDWDRGCSPD